MASLIRRPAWQDWPAALVVAGALRLTAPGMAQEVSPLKDEMALKVAFIYNFALFTEWPAEVGSTLNLCILGRDSFGREVGELQGKAVGSRSISVQRKGDGDSLKACQITFISASAIAQLPRVLGGCRAFPPTAIMRELRKSDQFKETPTA